MKKLISGLALVMMTSALALVSIPTHAQDTADFATNGPVGNLFTSTSTDAATGITAQGLYFDGATWSDANLYRRNDPNDNGFGVCNPIESAATGTGDCPGPQPAGDINELDNAGEAELIVLQLPDGFQWVSVQISSMDTNDGGPVPERGILYADGDGVLSSTFGDVGDNTIETFTGGVDPVEDVIIIDPAYVKVPFLVFEAFDHTGAGATNNDYLVYQATIRPAENGGGQGCTPGYWKQKHHFGSWLIDPPGGLYADVFGVSASFDVTLLGALRQGGGGEIALARHATAALLNSLRTDVSYALSSSAVIALVQEAYASGRFGRAKQILEAENQRGCPLGRAELPVRDDDIRKDKLIKIMTN